AAIVASALACGLLSELNAQAIKAAELPPAQREAIEGIIHDYVLKNPDVLIEALQNAQDKLNHEADAKATKVLSKRASEIFDDPAMPVGGNPKGDVNIIEFFRLSLSLLQASAACAPVPAERGPRAALCLYGVSGPRLRVGRRCSCGACRPAAR